MKKIHETIKLFLKEHNLDNPNLIYLVAFSGGFDSMCLLNSLKKSCKNKIIALHLNHKWRGIESDNEEKNCINFCNSIGIECYCENLSLDIAHTETAAREARYNFFERCSNLFKSNIIFTAHNKNDNVETVLYRLCTGTGLNGLQGIARNREKYFRPLLSIERTEIEDYCKEMGLIPNNDSSNSNIKYKRNYIRAEILPRLQQVNPNAIQKIDSLILSANEENQIIEEYIEKIIKKIKIDNKISTRKFLELSDSVQKRIIYNIFIEENIDYDRKKILNILTFINENSSSKSGKTCSLTKDLWIFTSKEFIQIIESNNQKLPELQILKEGTFEYNDWVLEIEKFNKSIIKYPKDSQNCVYVNLKNVPFAFELRQRKDGDIISPLGLNGTQKLKKYLNAKKIPNHEKNNLLFLAQGNEILWAIGIGISNKIKVQSNPTHRIKFYKNK